MNEDIKNELDQLGNLVDSKIEKVFIDEINNNSLFHVAY